MKIDLSFDEEEMKILLQWYIQAKEIHGIHSGLRKSDDLMRKLVDAYDTEKKSL